MVAALLCPLALCGLATKSGSASNLRLDGHASAGARQLSQTAMEPERAKELLGLEKGQVHTENDVKTAWKKKAMKFHPDRVHSRVGGKATVEEEAQATEKFKVLTEAKDLLLKPQYQQPSPNPPRQDPPRGGHAYQEYRQYAGPRSESKPNFNFDGEDYFARYREKYKRQFERDRQARGGKSRYDTNSFREEMNARTGQAAGGPPPSYSKPPPSGYSSYHSAQDSAQSHYDFGPTTQPGFAQRSLPMEAVLLPIHLVSHIDDIPHLPLTKTSDGASQSRFGEEELTNVFTAGKPIRGVEGSYGIFIAKVPKSNKNSKILLLSYDRDDLKSDGKHVKMGETSSTGYEFPVWDRVLATLKTHSIVPSSVVPAITDSLKKDGRTAASGVVVARIGERSVEDSVQVHSFRPTKSFTGEEKHQLWSINMPVLKDEKPRGVLFVDQLEFGKVKDGGPWVFMLQVPNVQDGVAIFKALFGDKRSVEQIQRESSR